MLVTCFATRKGVGAMDSRVLFIDRVGFEKSWWNGGGLLLEIGRVDGDSGLRFGL